jgi:hypothetical protein
MRLADYYDAFEYEKGFLVDQPQSSQSPQSDLLLEDLCGLSDLCG